MAVAMQCEADACRVGCGAKLIILACCGSYRRLHQSPMFIFSSVHGEGKAWPPVRWNINYELRTAYAWHVPLHMVPHLLVD